MKDKIIQTIPCTAELWAKYSGVDDGKEYSSLLRVVCFALMETAENRRRYGVPRTISRDGYIEPIDFYGDFVEVVGSWKENTP